MGVNGIYGLSGSGLDIESMVKVGMLSKQNQYNKMQQTYTKNEWKKEAYLEVYDKIQTYNTSTLSSFKMSSSMNAREATSSDEKIKVTADSSAPAMNHTISVNNTATNAYLNGTTSLKRGSSGTSSSTDLKDSLFSSYSIGTLDSNGKYDNVTFYSWETETKTTTTTVPDTGSETTTTYTDYKVAASFTNVTTDTLKNTTALSFGIGDGTDTGTVSLSYLEMVKGSSYYDFVSKFNSQGLNARATYDAAQDNFAIYNMKTGTANSVSISIGTDSGTDTAAATAVHFLNGMGLKPTANGTSSSVSKFSQGSKVTVFGQNASVTIDGTEFTNIDSNSLKVKGVTYNFANVTEKTEATVTVEQDVDKIVDNVKSFVESYNTLLNDLYDMYRETPNSSYAPLTDAQKNEMTEEQIKKWEEKAKSGMLYHDRTLRTIIDNMRNAVSNTITYDNGTSYKYDSAYSIGISTKGLYGQLQLDEDKLREALTDDSESVYRVFAKLDTTKSDVTDQANGIAQRLGGVMSNATNSIKNISGTSSDISDDSTLNVLLRNLQTRMSNFQSMMNAFETSLYKKYDAMEAALASLGTQLNYVTSAFGG